MNLEEIINKYTNYLYTIITNMSKGILSNEDIEEIISDVFVVFWQNKDKFDTNKKLNLYLAGITKNVVKNKFRKLHIDNNIDDYENIANINYNDINYEFEKQEKFKIIENTLNKMPKIDKIIFILFYYNSKSIKDISKKVKLSELSVKSRLYRIRKNIKKELEKGGYSYE